MKKRTKIIIGSLSIPLLILIGYSLTARFGILTKNKVEYKKEVSEEKISEQSDISEERSAEKENIKKEEIIRNEIAEELPDRKKTAQQEPQENKKEEPVSNIGRIVDRLMSSGFKQSSDRKIDTIIVHTSYNAIGNDPYDISDIIKQYEQYEVSAHYLIGRDGTIYRLVKEKDIAWHAGVSKMPDGRTNVNDFSIGIEVVNTKDGKFSDAQYKALNKLIADIKERYNIKNILGHDDIAPGRKTDPWGIDWSNVDR